MCISCTSAHLHLQKGQKIFFRMMCMCVYVWKKEGMGIYACMCNCSHCSDNSPLECRCRMQPFLVPKWSIPLHTACMKISASRSGMFQCHSPCRMLFSSCLERFLARTAWVQFPQKGSRIQWGRHHKRHCSCTILRHCTGSLGPCFLLQAQLQWETSAASQHCLGSQK